MVMFALSPSSRLPHFPPPSPPSSLSSHTHTVGLFAIRKSGFKDYCAIPKELDLVEREDQITFEIGLDDEVGD